MSVFKNLYVKGNLDVSGKSSSINSQNMLIGDPFQLINSKLTSTLPIGNESSGISMNYSTSNLYNPSLIVFDASTNKITLTMDDALPTTIITDFILITNSMHNNGIYEVKSGSGKSIIISNTPIADYISNNQITDETSNKTTLSYISLSIIQSNDNGAIQIGFGSDATELDSSFKNVLTVDEDTKGIFATITLTNATNQLSLNNNSSYTSNVILTTKGDAKDTSSIYIIPTVDDTEELPAEFIMSKGKQTLYDKVIHDDFLILTAINYLIQDKTPPIIICPQGSEIFMPDTVEQQKLFNGREFKIIFRPEKLIEYGVVNIYGTKIIGTKDKLILNKPGQHVSLTLVNNKYYINL
jgi:hypothetical protein